MKYIESTNQYLVKMSVGFEVRIQENELKKATEIWQSGAIGVFKQGIIAGKFIAGIVEDKDREIVRDIETKDGRRFNGIRPLMDVFDPILLKRVMEKKLLSIDNKI